MSSPNRMDVSTVGEVQEFDSDPRGCGEWVCTHHGRHADVAELADALDSGSSSRKGVEVQVLSSAPIKSVFYERLHPGRW